jgi:NADPH:quinone reductase-like Zn-dependent oxidoreductase
LKALTFKTTGNPSGILSVEDLPDPKPGAGEVLVRVRLSPIHPSDLHVLRGRFGRQPVLPASPGSECLGVVDAVGPGVSTEKVGSRVALLDVPGTWRELIVCPVDRAISVPEEVSDEDASQALVNPVTAWVMTMVDHALQKQDWLLQSASGSTVGRLVLQLSQTYGFRTVNLVRRQAQIDEIRDLGGSVVICTADPDWTDQLAAASDGKGFLRAIDCVAGRTGAAIARALAPGGRLLVYGALSAHRQTDASAFELPLFAPRLIYSAADIRGWFLYHWIATNQLGAASEVLEHVLKLMAARVLRLPPAVRYPVWELAAALQAADDPARSGKPLLDFDDARVCH